MSKRKDVIVVYSQLKPLYSALRKSLPNADIRDAMKEEESEKPKTDSERIFTKVKPSEFAVMKEADILLMSSITLMQIMYDLPPTVKWVQLMNTGVDRNMKSFQKDKPIPPYVITRNIATDIGRIMAEYVVGQVICHERSWHLSREKQLQKTYDRCDRFSLFRSMNQLHVGILGLGPMGLEVARSLQHFGCRISGYSRTPKGEADKSPYVDAYWHTGELSSFLRGIDYIIGILPSTPETRGILGGDVLKDAKRSPVLINVGRGDLVSEKDLLRALDAGWISAALLDVFEKEPLPKESSLWGHPKVIVTPHVSGYGNNECRTASVVECFLQNYRLFTKGEPLQGTVDWDRGY